MTELRRKMLEELVKVGTRRVRQCEIRWHPRPEDDGLALGVAVKPHACGVPLMRFQGLTAPPGQESIYAVYAKKWVFSANELRNLLTLSERSNPNFLTFKELKENCGADGFCLQSFDGTEAAFRLICFLFNLIAEFKRELTQDHSPRLSTLPTKVLVIGAILGREGRHTVLQLGLRER